MPADTVFMKSGNLLRVCELTDTDGNAARIEPYLIFTSGRNRRCCHYYQLSEPAGWKTTELRFVASVRMLEERFLQRKEYDPFDKERFPLVHFSVPTLDGRLRWVDKMAAADKSKLPYQPTFDSE